MSGTSAALPCYPVVVCCCCLFGVKICYRHSQAPRACATEGATMYPLITQTTRHRRVTNRHCGAYPPPVPASRYEGCHLGTPCEPRSTTAALKVTVVKWKNDSLRARLLPQELATTPTNPRTRQGIGCAHCFGSSSGSWHCRRFWGVKPF